MVATAGTKFTNLDISLAYDLPAVVDAHAETVYPTGECAEVAQCAVAIDEGVRVEAATRGVKPRDLTVVVDAILVDRASPSEMTLY